jgi:flagellar biosynthetic protein FlhB
VSLLVAFVLLYYMGMTMYKNLQNTMVLSLGKLFYSDFTSNTVLNIVVSQIYEMAKLLLPVMGGLMLVGLVVSYAQTGFLLNFGLIKPKLEKLNVIANTKGLFSLKSLVKLGFSVVKLLVIGGMSYLFIKKELVHIMDVIDFSITQILAMVAKLTYVLSLRVSVVLVILAVIDYIYQKRHYIKSLRMTKQEVKEESKQAEGDPLIKSKIKSKQIQMALKRMMAALPTADVVVTNPTHYAVALKYDGKTMKAPKVIAKGADLIALRIKEVARKYKIPLVENKPLAQTLYKTVEIGKEIPQKLYYAVAKVLSYVYQLKKKN